jgi:hypothetical protein
MIKWEGKRGKTKNYHNYRMPITSGLNNKKKKSDEPVE